MTTPALHALVARLVEQLNYPLVDADNLDAFLAQPGDSVLFCAGDALQHPEVPDVAVVLPELLASLPTGRLRPAVVSRGLEAAMQARYGFNRWPCLVFLRDGEYVGIIPGMQDWSVYQQRIEELMAATPSRPPSIGIAVSTNASHCH